MPKVAILPTPLARAALAGSNPRNAATCGIYDVAGRLGQAHRKPKWLSDYIEQLIEKAGFPKAYPVLKAGKLASGVTRDSRWCRAAVDLWFDGQLPPGSRDAGAVAGRVEVDSRLNTNLHSLFEDVA
ncbi:hypothetical protein [Sphingomonas sp. GV3]|uniref:hypothetical protein n=1 Tax=Sphingomonas sp. GV3 TaxID=3040671 RepID=UPI00280BAE05|nr:hypothetical protein [Sphingomonas sp. GV3]